MLDFIPFWVLTGLFGFLASATFFSYLPDMRRGIKSLRRPHETHIHHHHAPNRRRETPANKVRREIEEAARSLRRDDE